MEHSLIATYNDMENRGIYIVNQRLKKRKAVSAEDGFVCIDCARMETTAEEHTVIIHEDGHFVSGAFYNPYSSYQMREQAEYRADKQAILKWIPCDEIIKCCECGIAGLWELAEYFCVTESFMQKALDFYRDVKIHG